MLVNLRVLSDHEIEEEVHNERVYDFKHFCISNCDLFLRFFSNAEDVSVNSVLCHPASF